MKILPFVSRITPSVFRVASTHARGLLGFLLFAAMPIFGVTSALGDFVSLHSLNGVEGAKSYAALVQGSDGDFYGTASEGGFNDFGTVFKVTSAGSLTVLYHFRLQPGNGVVPFGGLIQGGDGNFYGTTFSGNAEVFKITSS